MSNAQQLVWVTRVLADGLCHSRCGTLTNPRCSMAKSSEHRSKCAVLHLSWWRLHMSENFTSGTKNPKQIIKHFRCFVIIFIRKGHRPSFGQTLIPFGKNWSSGSEEEVILFSPMYFRYLVIMSTWKTVPINLNPLNPRVLYAKFGRWFWRRILFNFNNLFPLFLHYFSLKM